MASHIISELHEPHLFHSKHHVHTKTADGKELITITGTAAVLFEGTGSESRRESVALYIEFPVARPVGEMFRVHQWAPFVTINSIENRGHAVNAEWAVESFGGSLNRPDIRRDITDAFLIPTVLKVRDSDGEIIRVGYHVTLVGEFVDDGVGVVDEVPGVDMVIPDHER
jgi:hypothetical protein